LLPLILHLAQASSLLRSLAGQHPFQLHVLWLSTMLHGDLWSLGVLLDMNFYLYLCPSRTVCPFSK
jgi:hypothetical protein